jgi:hypothetical protein
MVDIKKWLDDDAHNSGNQKDLLAQRMTLIELKTKVGLWIYSKNTRKSILKSYVLIRTG